MTRLYFESPLVSADWLQTNLHDAGLVVLDASWFLPGSPRNGEAEWRQCRVPGARFFDFDNRLADPGTPLPHMLPSESIFGREMGLLGITNKDTILAYDSQGIFSAPRAWWMLRAMGHQKVAVLDGGLPAWQAAGGELETSAPEARVRSNYHARLQPEWVMDKATLLTTLDADKKLVLDARSAGRFLAKEPEPRVGVRGGHMPGSVNLPFADLLEQGAFRKPTELIARFDSLEPDRARPLVFSCGSGVSACVLALAASIAGRMDLAVYDGSWAEWGGSPECPVVS